MSRGKNNKFRKPIGTAKKTGDSEAWPWERKSGFCQSHSHPWHVCLASEKLEKKNSYHVLFSFIDQNSAFVKARSLNKVYQSVGSRTYIRNWVTGKKIVLD